MAAAVERLMCASHRPEKVHRLYCAAVKLQRRLQKRGYVASQYQGVVTTNAPAALVATVAAAVEALHA